eukprot:PITA_01426
MFLAFKAFVEKQSGHQIFKLRSDNGGEYVDNKLINFCTEHGIQMQYTVPYTPQQNGVAERKNRTLKEMANCMPQYKGLSLNFWAETINCANYIVNCTPSKVLKNITLEKAWSSIKPDVSHFCVFGSEAWAHIPNEKHKTLEPKSEKCIFVGYSEDVKGYRLILLKIKNVIIRRDVKFAENISTYEPSSADVPSLSIPFPSENISSSDDDSEDDNPPPPSQDPPSTPHLPKWVRATRDAVGALAGGPTDQRRTRSQLDRASSLLAQASANYDPDTFAEASGHLDWDTTMNDEYRSLLTDDTWDLVPLPKGRKLVRCKWVYRAKFGPDEKVDKHKARLVAKGFSQVEGIDYTETFSPVAKMNSIRLVLSLAASFKWEVHRWMLNLPSCMGTCMKKSIWSNLLALYKQIPALCHSDNTVYTKKVGKSLIILVLYVDNLILTGSDPNLINHVKSSLKKQFEMTDLRHLHYFLGLQVLQSKQGISLSQSKYACNLLRHFHMEDCKLAPSPFQSGVKLSVTCTSPEVDATLYHQLVGKLLYLTHTHPDLSFVVGLVARFMQNPRESQWKAAKRILRYVRGTVQFGIHYSAEASPLLVGFTDSDWAGGPDDRKSIAGYVFTLGSGPITWACKEQAAISLSLAEAEYRGVVEASKEALWLRQILSEFGF